MILWLYDLVMAGMLSRANALLDGGEQAGTAHANTVKASCTASPETREIF